MKNFRKYDPEWLNDLVSKSRSMREVLIKAGRAPTGGENYRLLKNKIREYGIDTSHFTGRASNCGEFYKGGHEEKYEIKDVFCKNSPVTQRVLRSYVERHHLLVYECAICGSEGEDWEGKIALELDHINGDNTDNRIENLRYLCPNCHAHTSTYRGKNKRLKSITRK